MSQQLNLLLEIRDRVTRIEDRVENFPAMQAKLASHEVKLVKIEARWRAIKWVSIFLFVTVPTLAATIVKAFKG